MDLIYNPFYNALAIPNSYFFCLEFPLIILNANIH